MLIASLALLVNLPTPFYANTKPLATIATPCKGWLLTALITEGIDNPIRRWPLVFPSIKYEYQCNTLSQISTYALTSLNSLAREKHWGNRNYATHLIKTCTTSDQKIMDKILLDQYIAIGGEPTHINHSIISMLIVQNGFGVSEEMLGNQRINPLTYESLK